MNENLMLKHFDRISEAPDAVARLRRFIFDLAVRGKLVEQDPNDEPAAELLKRIRSEKARCEKKPKELAPVTVDEAPFDVPAGWEWVRIRQITTDRGQTVPKGDFTYIDVTAINKERGCIGEPTVLSSTDAPSRARKVVKKGDVIYSCVRPYLLNIAIVDTEISPPPIASTAFAVMNGFGLTLPQYLWTALRSPFMVESVEERMRGQAYPAINDSDFSLLPISLPPLAEQHRIVAKVDELMALCDQLQAAQNEREARRDRLMAASLHCIGTAPATADEAETGSEMTTPLPKAARFHLDHLPRLTTRPEHIKQLRQTILNLAVRGHLVPQDPNDEPAAELLKLIDSNKAKFVKAGTIRNVSALAKLVTNEEPFSLSQGWIWARIGSVGYTQTGTTPPTSKPECFGGDTPFVTPSDLSGTITTYGGKGLTDVGVRHSRLIQKNSVLMVCIGSTIGKTNVVDREVCCNQQINTVTPFVEGMTSYFAIALRSAYFQGLVFAKAGMGTLPILSKGKWELLPIPLPPLAEQHRIVAKVDELMALCDQLEALLTTTQTDSRRLLEAVLRDALVPAKAEATV